MKKFALFFLLALVIIQDSDAQFTRYVVKLKNKGGGNPYTFSNPAAYLSARAINRRTRYNIPIDSTDLPVTPAYVNQIRSIPNLTVLNVSRWFNALTIQTSSSTALASVNALPFVEGVTSIAARMAERQSGYPEKYEPAPLPLPGMERPGGIAGDYFNYGTTSYNEIHLHNGEFLHNIGMRGQAMQIAMLDNGFNNYLSASNDAFDSANANGQVLGTWDFVANEANVSNDGNHGMQCYSTIVANVPGIFVGKAPKASFWLYQTEDNASEFPIEEFNWACGAERADSTGAEVISSSLGYGYDFDGGLPDYTYSSMDGNTHIAAIAADLAAKKGLLVFVAAGNAGQSPFHYIITPADADSAVAVGAVNSSGVVGGFSSYGPSGDGQVKPDVASVGVSALVQYNGFIGTNNGTSFACPNMAGLGTCLWQAFPEYNNMRIVQALRMAGDRASNPDNRTGYGIPNMKTAFSSLLAQFATSSSSYTGCAVTINWTSKDVNLMKYEIERKGPTESNYTKVGESAATGGPILSVKSYSFVNNLTSGSSGIYSYRIRQIIDTATASFSATYIDTTNVVVLSPCIVTGTGNVDPSRILVSIQPNPVQASTANLVVVTPRAISKMPIMIYDANGRLVLQITEQKSSGRKTIVLPVANLAKGRYYVRVMEGEQLLGVAELLKL